MTRKWFALAILMLSFIWGGQGQGQATAAKNFDLPEGGKLQVLVFYQDGAAAEIQVVSEKETDVDLYVKDAKGRTIAKDVAPGKDCKAQFTAGETNIYEVIVVNLGPGANRSTLRHNGREIIFKTIELEPFSLREEEKKSFFVSFPAGKPAAAWVTSVKKTDVDLFIYDKDNNPVVADARIGKDCYVTWVPKETQVFRVEVVNLGPGENRCTLKHTVEK